MESLFDGTEVELRVTPLVTTAHVTVRHSSKCASLARKLIAVGALALQ